jgi:DNA replication and repair protein RecF
MSYVSSIRLTSFRNYESARIENLEPGIIVLCGPNGAGKTNILEALSLLSPGRGLRGAKLSEMQKRENRESEKIKAPWTVSATVVCSQKAVRIGTGMDPDTEKRVVRINGETMRGQNALTEYISCVWLTPQMDRIFTDSAGSRRRFLDRLVFTFDPGHSGRVSRYENALGQRSKLLREGNTDTSWLSALESQIAETGVAISAARIDYAEKLHKACENLSNKERSGFPKASVSIKGFPEEVLSQKPALEIEEIFRAKLEDSRKEDALTGGASTGPHRSDLTVYYDESLMPAENCSTGEQKALLTGIILAHASLVGEEICLPPLLLLDEIAGHLDEARRSALYRILQDMKYQTWVTGTDEKIFSELKGKAQFFRIDNACIEPGGLS